ncbi:MAG: Extracellular solute-binding protein, family 5 [uncultured bacterium]|nr:MAG: Extracellular solute-binding protein, family 5 [uncultured bacterium]
MLNLRYIFRLVGAFVSRFKVLIFVGIGFGVVFFFLLKFLIPALSFGETTRIGLTGRYTAASLPSSILNLIGNGLTKIEEDGSVAPDLASSWETTDKGKTWIFTLKDNVYWQDGDKVTSKTINYQFSDVTVERPDEKTIVFKLQNTYSAFPAVVSRPTFKSGLLGTGAWEVDKISLNGSNVEELKLVSKKAGDIVYKFYPTEERTKIAFELGEIDKIEDLFDTSPFDTWPKVKISNFSSTGEFVAVFFNTQDSFLTEKNLRQALSYAINKEALGGLRAISPISIDSWAYNPQVKPYHYDAKKAKEMIEDYKEANKFSDFTINLATSPLLLDKAELISNNWREAGVNVDINVVTTMPSDFQAFLAILDMPEDPDQYSIWHSTQNSTNITRYENPRIDKLLEDGRSEIDLSTRKRIYLDFQRFLVEDSPAAFLYYPTTYTVSRK